MLKQFQGSRGITYLCLNRGYVAFGLILHLELGHLLLVCHAGSVSNPRVLLLILELLHIIKWHLEHLSFRRFILLGNMNRLLLQVRISCIQIGRSTSIGSLCSLVHLCSLLLHVEELFKKVKLTRVVGSSEGVGNGLGILWC